MGIGGAGGDDGGGEECRVEMKEMRVVGKKYISRI